MWGKLKERLVAADVMSAAAVQQFFTMNKLEAHSRRATPGSVKTTLSSVVWKLISSLYAHSISRELRMDIHTSLLPQVPESASQ
jgi:hypothetical protein